MTDLPASVNREKDGVGYTYKRGNMDDLVKKWLFNQKVQQILESLGSQKIIKDKYSYDKVSKRLLEYYSFVKN